MTNVPNIQVETTAKFDRKLKKLAKRYRNVKQDLKGCKLQKCGMR